MVSPYFNAAVKAPPQSPNVQIEGLRAFAQSLSNAGLGSELLNIPAT
jgi:hypothetical protein